MPAADQARVLTRVTTILNLSAAGTFSSTLSPRNKTRHADEIAAFVTEAGMKILRTIAETPGNEYRNALVNTVAAVHGEKLPEHQGMPVFVEIQAYAGAAWQQGDRRDYRKIQSWRENPEQVYDEFNHDEEKSSLSGYYDIWERRFYFTGNAARVGLTQIVRADVATKVPEIFENTWVKLAVGESVKVGSGTYDSQVAALYGGQGQADLNEFRGGKRQFPEVSDPEPTSAVHK